MATDLVNVKRPKKYKCPDCGSNYTSYILLKNHVEKMHKELIPDGHSVNRYIFNRRNKKDFQLCVICKKNHTKFNEETLRYNRFCSDECKRKAGEMAERNLRRKTGMTRSERLQSPETQKEMLKNRNIAGVYTFKNGTKINYVGSYELDFLKFYENDFKGDPIDIMECPFTFEYIYENKKHFYIPDFYIENLNLIIEIKDGAPSNMTNQAIINSSQVKETLKDEVMKENGKFNFIKIRDMEYTDFLEAVQILKERNISTESYETLFINPAR